MTFATRYALKPRRYVPVIPEDEVWYRTIAAIKALRAMPDSERRFLMAGQGSWLAKLGSVLTWHDMNAHEDKTLEPLERVHIDIPRDIEEFFGLPGDYVDRAPDMPPSPMRVGDVSQARVDFRSARMQRKAEKQWPNPVKYVPAARVPPKKEPEQPREVYRPTRREISDAMIAGAWFANLALLDWNVAEFERNLEAYRVGRKPNGQPVKSARVEDQQILSWVAFGWSSKLIGERLKLNEHQTERRLSEMRQSLFEIANGRAKLANIDERRAARKRDKARTFGG